MWFSGRWHCDFCVGIFLVIVWGESACVIRGMEGDSRVFRWRWRDLGSKDYSVCAFINFIDRLYWEARKPPPNSCSLICDYQRILEFFENVSVWDLFGDIRTQQYYFSLMKGKATLKSKSQTQSKRLPKNKLGTPSKTEYRFPHKISDIETIFQQMHKISSSILKEQRTVNHS